jgi:hypothetical protein
MAYMNQERKAQRAPAIKAICKKYGVKATLSIRNHSTLVLNIKAGSIDFIGNYNSVCSQHPRYNGPIQFCPAVKGIQVNPYWYKEHFDGEAREFLQEVLAEMYGNDYYDESDSMADYFHCSHYVDINIGRWNQPYQLLA